MKIKSVRPFVRRMTGVDDPDFLSPEQANDVIEALKSWNARVAPVGDDTKAEDA